MLDQSPQPGHDPALVRVNRADRSADAAATSRGSLPSTPVMKKACHSVAETSACTFSAAQPKRRRRYSRSNSADWASHVSGTSSISWSMAGSPVPRICRSRAASALIVRLRAMRDSHARNVPRRIGVKPVNGRGDGPENLLGKIDRVGVLKPAPTAPAGKSRVYKYSRIPTRRARPVAREGVPGDWLACSAFRPFLTPH